jgi:hypothetical protein
MIAITIPHHALAELCQHYHVKQLWVFGSVLRADFTPESDIDLIVEFQSELKPTYFLLAELQLALSELFGRSVDIGTWAALNPYIRQSASFAPQVLYECQ